MFGGRVGVVGEMCRCGVAAPAVARLHAGAGQRLFAMGGAGQPGRRVLMAIYHLDASTGSKGDPSKADKNGKKSTSAGKSAAAKHDYIAREGEYTYKGDRVLFLDSGNMPRWAAGDPRAYWDAADTHERVNGRLFKQVEFALPIELSLEQQIELTRKFVGHLTSNIDGGNLPYEYAIHEGVNKGGLREWALKQYPSDGTKPAPDPLPTAFSSTSPRNPHVHLMISERVNDGFDRSPELWFKRVATGKKKTAEQGGARKTEALKPEAWLENTRALWAELANEALANAGVHARIDHRSLFVQREEALAMGDLVRAAELDRAPQEHLGPAAHGYEARTGEKSRRREFIEARAAEYAVAAATRAEEKAELVKELAAAEREVKMLEHSARFIERSIPSEQLFAPAAPAGQPTAVEPSHAPAPKPGKPSIPQIVDAMAAMPARDRIEVAEQIAERACAIQPRAGVPAPVHASLLQILINKLRSIFGLKRNKEAIDGRTYAGNGPARLVVERGAAAPTAPGGAAGLGAGSRIGAIGLVAGGPAASAGRSAGRSVGADAKSRHRASEAAGGLSPGALAQLQHRMQHMSASELGAQLKHAKSALFEVVPRSLDVGRSGGSGGLQHERRSAHAVAAVTPLAAPIATLVPVVAVDASKPSSMPKAVLDDIDPEEVVAAAHPAPQTGLWPGEAAGKDYTKLRAYSERSMSDDPAVRKGATRSEAIAWAAREGDLETVEALVAAQADPTVKRGAAFEKAALKGYDEIFNVMLFSLPGTDSRPGLKALQKEWKALGFSPATMQKLEQIIGPEGVVDAGFGCSFAPPQSGVAPTVGMALPEEFKITSASKSEY